MREPTYLRMLLEHAKSLPRGKTQPLRRRPMTLPLRREETGDPNLINRLKEGYDRVVCAWKDAAGLYELNQN